MRHLLALDQLEKRRGVEALLQNELAPEIPSRHQRHEGAVEDERPGVHHHALGCEPELAGEHGAVQRPHVMRVDDPFWLTGRAARVDDVVDVIVSKVRGGRRIGARGRGERRVVTIPGSAWGVGQDVVVRRDLTELAARFVQRLDHRAAGEHRFRIGIAQQRHETRPAQQWAQRYGHDAELRARPIRLQQLDAIGKDDRQRVALPHTERAQHVGEPVHACVMLGEREPVRAAHDRRVTPAVACVARQQRADVHRSTRTPRNSIVPISGEFSISTCFLPSPHWRSWA